MTAPVSAAVPGLALGPAPALRPAPVPGPVLVGIDVVETSRITGLLGRYGAAAARRVCTDAEVDWVGPVTAPDAAGRLAAVFALKESAIKAMSGRPAGFRWQSLQTRVRAPFAVPLEVATLMGDFVSHRDAGPAAATGGQVGGRAAARRAGLLPGPAHVLGMGRYLVQGDHVLATVCFWSDVNAMGGGVR